MWLLMVYMLGIHTPVITLHESRISCHVMSKSLKVSKYYKVSKCQFIRGVSAA